MENLYLTPGECAQFGLTPVECKALWEGIFARVGYLFGLDGTGGSGVFVKDTAGDVALLTAAHVVMPRVRQGQLWVGAYNDNQEGAKPGDVRRVVHSKPAVSIRVSTMCDAALVYIPADDLKIFGFLDIDEWDPRTHVDPREGTHVIAAGLPGDWKTVPDLVNRRIAQARTLLLWTESTNVFPQDGLIQCKAMRHLPDLSSFAGMSGGPLFTLRGRLLGVMESATLDDDHEGSLFATQRSGWFDLMHERKPTNAPRDQDLTGEYIACSPIIGDEEGGWEIELEIKATLFWSPTDPRYGGFGRIYAIEFDKGDIAKRRVVNVDWTFPCENNYDEAARRQSLAEQIHPLLAKLDLPGP